MKTNTVAWIAIIVILLMGFSAGCGQSSNVAQFNGVQFNNEAKLEQEGFLVKLNQEVNVGDEKLVFEKVAFDRDSMAFAYKGGTVPLAGSEMNLKGLERNKTPGITEIDTTTSFGATVGSDYHVVVVPHRLKLVNQKITVEVNINGRGNEFTLNFPGDIINSSTTDVMADSKGNLVQDAAKASIRVIVGIGYTLVENKGNSDFVVEDKDKHRLEQSNKVSSTGESIAVYEPLPLPRSSPRVKIDTVKKVIVLLTKGVVN